MLSNYIIALLSGGLIKVYDDIVDIPEYGSHFSNTFIILLKISLIALMIIMSINNANIPLIIFTFILIMELCVDSNTLDDTFYKVGMIVTFIMVCYTFTISNINYIIGSTVALALIGGFIDHKLFPEDHSINKIIGRSTMCILLFLSKDTLKHVVEYDLIWFGIGYMGISVIDMLYISK